MAMQYHYSSKISLVTYLTGFVHLKIPSIEKDTSKTQAPSSVLRQLIEGLPVHSIRYQSQNNLTTIALVSTTTIMDDELYPSQGITLLKT